MEDLRQELSYVREMIDNCTGGELLSYLKREEMAVELKIAAIQENTAIFTV